jgi:hypothetical protein
LNSTWPGRSYASPEAAKIALFAAVGVQGLEKSGAADFFPMNKLR